MCGARCTNQYCIARVTFDCHNYSRSMFAKKFNRRVPVGQKADRFKLLSDFFEEEEETQEENNDIGQSDELL